MPQGTRSHAHTTDADTQACVNRLLPSTAILRINGLHGHARMHARTHPALAVPLYCCSTCAVPKGKRLVHLRYTHNETAADTHATLWRGTG
jgi:hypothetical protein